MKLLVATDAHMYVTPDGKHYCKAIYGYNFWQRYLNVFDGVRIVARTESVDCPPPKCLLVDDAGVEVFAIPSYRGPVELAKKYFSIHRIIKTAFDKIDVAIFRMPSQTAYMAFQHCPKGIPVGGEIVYDPNDDLSNENNNILIKVLNRQISNQLKRFCIKANGVSYVTERTIQEHYPSYSRLHGEDARHFETYYSTITLSNNAYLLPRKYDVGKKLKVVLSSVSMNSERKGEKILIDAVKTARDRGYDVTAIIIGDGSLRSSFEEYAKSKGLEDSILFTGLLPSSDDVREVMVDADMFIFPTQGEGLPRGILEAMAIGLPVLSTHVGGIPEVIDSKYLFSPYDALAFADEMCRLINNPDELTEMSKKNFNKSLEFKNELLQEKRDNFYRRLGNLVRR